MDKRIFELGSYVKYKGNTLGTNTILASLLILAFFVSTVLVRRYRRIRQSSSWKRRYIHEKEQPRTKHQTYEAFTQGADMVCVDCGDGLHPVALFFHYSEYR